MTHSPALVNRLRADELIVCERGPDGASLIPAIDTDTVRAKERAAGDRLRLGEIWFSGTLGGVIKAASSSEPETAAKSQPETAETYKSAYFR